MSSSWCRKKQACHPRTLVDSAHSQSLLCFANSRIIVSELSKTYIRLDATASFGDGIHAGYGRSDRFSFWSEVLVDCLNRFISVEAFVPRHLVFINNL